MQAVKMGVEERIIDLLLQAGEGGGLGGYRPWGLVVSVLVIEE
jgi:hypothetical protein